MIDIGEPIRTRQLDQGGNVLPADVTQGSLVASSAANEPEDAASPSWGCRLASPRVIGATRSARTALMLTALLAAATPAAGQCLAQPLAVTPKQIAIRSASALGALLQLGRLASVCFGIEVGDDRLATAGVAWAQPASVQRLLGSVLSAAGGYTMREQGRVLSIFPPASPEGTWLDARIPQFRAPRAGVQTMSNLLFMDLRLVEDPAITSFAGRYPGGVVGDRVGPFDERNRTVREILNMIVGSSMGGLWITVQPHARSERLGERPFWVIVQYAESPAKADAQMQSAERQIRSAFGSPPSR
jgi:hypothetical protein